jgi:transposase
MSLRLDFVTLAGHADANLRELCRHFGISPNTAYKWLARYRAEGPTGLADRSRRPAISPGQTAPGMEQLVLATREAHPVWGGRKLKAYLEAAGYLHHHCDSAPARGARSAGGQQTPRLPTFRTCRA